MSLQVPSASAPLRSKAHDLLDVLDEKGLYAMTLMLPALAEDIREAHTPLPKGMDSVLQDTGMLRSQDRHGFRLTKLITAIPPGVLRGILQGTIMQDMDPQNPDVVETYSSSTPGIYVAGVVVRGRQGTWLNRIEIANLADKIASYSRAWLAKQPDCALSVPVKARDLTWQQIVDTQASGSLRPSYNECLFIDSVDDHDRACHLAEQLKQRCNAALDTSGKTRHVQSPFYVGFSDSIEDSASLHTSKTWELIDKCLGLACAALSAMDVDADIAVHPVLPIWVKRDMPDAELLVSCLGRTLVTMDGFNSKLCSGQYGTMSADECRAAQERVYVDNPWCLANVDALSLIMGHRTHFIHDAEAVDEMVKLQSDQLSALLAEQNKLLADVATLPPETLAERMPEVIAQRNELRAKRDSLRPLYQHLDKLADLFRSLLPGIGDIIAALKLKEQRPEGEGEGERGSDGTRPEPDL